MTQHNETDVIVEANHDLEYAASLLLNDKKSPEQAKQILIQDGIDASRANEIVNHLDEHISQYTRERSNKDLLHGALWCLGGTVLSVIGYQTEGTANGFYVFTLGAIAIGILQFTKGLLRF